MKNTEKQAGGVAAQKIVIIVFLLFGLLAGTAYGNDPGAGGGSHLGPPSQLIADPGPARVTLKWIPARGADGYAIYYSTSRDMKKEEATRLRGRSSPFPVRDLKNHTPYYFAVAALRSGEEGPLSKGVTATPSPNPPPAAPMAIAVESGPGEIRLSWNASPGATSYSVYYSTRAGLTRREATKVAAVKNAILIAPLVNGTTYYFAVTASNANGEGALSFETTGTPRVSPPLPPPSKVEAVEGDKEITLSWSPVAGARSYTLYYGSEFLLRKETSAKIEKITSPYTVKELANSRAYFLMVCAVNEGGEGLASEIVSATPVGVRPVQKLIPIPGGEFLMGDRLDNTPYALPVHKVRVDAFFMDRYETTHDLWKEVHEWALKQGYQFDNLGGKGSLGMGTNMPVTMVNWYDVVKWCNARSEKEGRTPVYYTDPGHTNAYRAGRVDLTGAMVKWEANGYRLPTEAEWERATRGGFEGRRYPWGDTFGSDKANHDMAKTTSVGVYPPNNYGLYDMAGNVFEWVWDRESSDYRWASEGIVNPRGPDEGRNRVRRGGGYDYGFRYHACHERMFRPPTYTAPYFGFRSVSLKP